MPLQSTTQPPLPLEFEAWCPVLGYEGLYEISDLGRVRRSAGGPGARAGRILRPQANHDGYLLVCLSREGVIIRHSIHRLVAEAFLGPCPAAREVNHINGTKADNRRVNLEWVTHDENQRLAAAAGLYICGEQHCNAKLTVAEVRVIRSNRGIISQRQLGRTFGVSHATIGQIQAGRRWKGI